MTATCVIASYRYGHLVSQAIESVIGQTVPFDSIIVVDDGVGDCDVVLDKYLVDYSDTMAYIPRMSNLGTVANFQDILMNNVFTDQVMFLGADNWLRPDTLEKCREHRADIISYDIALVGTMREQFRRKVGAWPTVDGYPMWRFAPGNIEQANYIHGSSLYNVDLAKKVGGYRASGGHNSEEDWMLWRAMLAAGAKHVHVPEPMLYYRRHKHNFIQPRGSKS